VTKEEVNDEFVEAVESILGMGSVAWDMIDPKEIIAAVITIKEMQEIVEKNK
jgi:hypothetical protein